MSYWSNDDGKTSITIKAMLVSLPFSFSFACTMEQKKKKRNLFTLLFKNGKSNRNNFTDGKQF
jgi:hypothetical protein